MDNEYQFILVSAKDGNANIYTYSNHKWELLDDVVVVSHIGTHGEKKTVLVLARECLRSIELR